MAKKNVELSNHSQARQQQLLAAALNVVARRGLSGITVNDIADEAGCSYGVIAFHFKTKERLLLEVLDFLASHYEDLWRETIRNAPEDPARRLQLLVDVDFDPRVAKTRYLAVWMAFWAEASRVPAYRKRCLELKTRSLATIIDLVSELAENRAMTIDAEAVARGLYALTDGCWLFAHVSGETSPAHRERSRRLCHTYLSAFFPKDFSVPVASPPGEEAGAVA